MGRTQAEGFAEAVAEGWIDLRRAIQYHLESNHYPPISYALFGGLALRAIEKANAGERDAGVKGPKGWEHRKYGAVMPAWAVIEELHLEAFVGGEAE